MILTNLTSTTDLVALICFPFLMILSLIAVYYTNKWRVEYIYEQYKKEYADYYDQN